MVQAPHRLCFRQFEHQHQKLITAPTKQHIVSTHHRPRRTRHRTDYLVTDRVAHRVVDRLQVVDVDHGNTTGRCRVLAHLRLPQQRMKCVPVQGFCQWIHLDQQLELIVRGEQFSVCHLNFAAHAFHQDHHRAEAEQYFKEQIENRGELQIGRRHSYSPETFARAKHRHVVEEIDCEEQQRR